MKVAFAVLAACASISSIFARELTFEDRVRAQEAIERVYYSHQIGTTKSFEEAVPRAAIEKKVRAGVEQAGTLASLGTPITIEDLSREWERMQARTRMPERLRELTRALGDDPELIRECLVRPMLATRLASGSDSATDARHDARFEDAVEATLTPSSSCVPLDT